MAAAALSAVVDYLSAAPEAELLRLSAYTMLAAGAAAFVALHFTTAPYGKYAPAAAWYYGCPINGKLAWVLQEAPSFLVAAGAWAAAVAAHKAGSGAGGGGVDPTALSPNTVLLGLYLLHYANRSFVFPLRLRGGKPTPFVVFLMALVFCVWNGWMQSAALLRHAEYPPGYLASPRFLGGVALFFTGMAVNWHSDGILIGLRKPGETGYKIPRVSREGVGNGREAERE
jgi:3-oxo-5-alpha-steroid 4-dehydrogenase 1